MTLEQGGNNQDSFEELKNKVFLFIENPELKARLEENFSQIALSETINDPGYSRTVLSDTIWASALIVARVPEDLILRAWDIRDDLSRHAREARESDS